MRTYDTTNSRAKPGRSGRSFRPTFLDADCNTGVSEEKHQRQEHAGVFVQGAGPLQTSRAS